MKGMERFASHPARDAAIASMQAVESGDRARWLALFTDDAVVEDPIGPSPFDPDGAGHHGANAIAGFYDQVVASGQIAFEIRESYAAGDECANVGTITTTFPDGSRAVVDGVYTYRTDGNGRIRALRAYWEYAKARLEAAD
ncbi:MAG TPA: nuclear transport factor 2 family protein [Acidimicrobiales bacterium]|jgi:ketosteroid isomerase-like protein|nr:nuclear transport factor 2 family protein [Acidimicrobiales bacterium]